MRRRIAATLGATALIGAMLAATSATAAPPAELESYGAGGTGTALELNVGGEAGLNLAVSQTGAVVTSDPAAAADGAALLIAGTPVPGGAPSAAPEGPETNEECAAEVDLDELTGGALSLLGLDLACVETAATITDGAPGASATTGEVQLTITAPGGDVLEPILGPVLEGVDDLTDVLIDDGICTLPGLGGLLCSGGDELLPIPLPIELEVDTLLDQLLLGLSNPNVVLAQVTVAPTVSQAGASAEEGVVGLSGANGATITVLPGIGQTLTEIGLDVPPLIEPILTVELGRSFASVERDPVTGEASTDGSSAQLLGVTPAGPLEAISPVTDALNDLLDALTEAGAPLNCDTGNPLADVLCIDLGEVRELDQAQLAALDLDFGEGTVGVTASAATVRVLPLAADFLGGDLLTLSLATSSAAANATLPDVEAPRGPEAPAPTPEQPPAQPSLPRTGAAIPMGILAALAGAGALGTTLVRRSSSS